MSWQGSTKFGGGRRAWPAALCFLCLILVAGPSWADDGQGLEALDDDSLEAMEAAEAHYRMAVELYARGRYRESVEEFDRVLEFHDDPVVHCNRAVPLIELGRLVEGRESLVRCRDAYDAGSRDYQEIAADVEALTLTLEAVRPTARAVADEVGAAGSPDRDISDTPVTPPPVAADPAPPTMSGVQIAGLVLLGTGAGLGGAAAVVDWRSAGLVDEFRREAQGGDGTSAQRHQELRQQIEARQQIFWGLAATGAATAAVGLGLSAWGLFRKPGGGGLSLDVSDQGVGAVWHVTF